VGLTDGAGCVRAKGTKEIPQQQQQQQQRGRLMKECTESEIHTDTDTGTHRERISTPDLD